MHFLHSVLSRWILLLLLLKGGSLYAQSTAKLYGVVTDQEIRLKMWLWLIFLLKKVLQPTQKEDMKCE